MSKARFSFDALPDQLRQRQLDIANQKRFAPSSTKVYFEPALSASTPPSGYNSALTPAANRLRAYYIRQDDVFQMWFSLVCGATFNPGVGQWTMAMPVPIPSSNTELLAANVGTWQAFDANTSNLAFGPIWINDANSVRFLYPAAYPVGVSSGLGAAAPWTWANGDLFGGYITFPIA